MTPAQILLLFFGLPVSILIIGMRRGLGLRGLGKVLGTAVLLSLVGWGWMRWLGHPLSEAAVASAGSSWVGAAYIFGSAIVGCLGGALVCLQGHGAEGEPESDPESEPTKRPVWVAAGFLAAVFVSMVSGLAGVELRRYGVVAPTGDSLLLGLAGIDLILVVPVGFFAGILTALFLGGRPSRSVRSSTGSDAEV